MKNNNEIWLDVVGYEGLYQVSSLGVVKRIPSRNQPIGGVIKPIDNGNGYFGVGLCKDGLKKRTYIHRIVAIAFHKNTNGKAEVNHIDGDRSNNKADNLEWVTRSENHKHRYDYLKQKGVNFGKTGKDNWTSKVIAKLNDSGNIIEIYYGYREYERNTGKPSSTLEKDIKRNRVSNDGHKYTILPSKWVDGKLLILSH